MSEGYSFSAEGDLQGLGVLRCDDRSHLLDIHHDHEATVKAATAANAGLGQTLK